MTTAHTHAEKPVTLGISLVSARITQDWPSAQRLLANTLRSVFQQTDQNLRVIIACHEVPDIEEVRDPRVTIVPVNFPPPPDRGEWRRDMSLKHNAIGAKLREFGGGWMFILDADDLVRSDLCARVRATTTKIMILARGYRVDVRRQRAQLLRWRFWRTCGSCIAVNWQVNELPRDAESDDARAFREYTGTIHHAAKYVFDRHGWSCSFEHQPLVAYMLNHGQNLSDIYVSHSLRWRLYFRIWPWRKWTTALERQYGGDPVSRQAAIYSGPDASRLTMGAQSKAARPRQVRPTAN
jgi:hypothetical protein